MSRRIVLTGVTRGLGRAMLERFSGAEHTVFGCATKATAIQRLRSEFAAPHQFDVVDVSDHQQVEAWAKKIVDEAGPPDLLINNAAIINGNSVLWETHPREFGALMDVNIKGVFHVVRSFLPAMIDQQRGIIVNFSSGWGRSTSPEVVPYCASKWAIEGLTKGLAQELPRGLAAVALNPGVIHTEMLESCFGDSASTFPDPGQWAERAVPFLLQLGPRDNGRSLDVPT